VAIFLLLFSQVNAHAQNFSGVWNKDCTRLDYPRLMGVSLLVYRLDYARLRGVSLLVYRLDYPRLMGMSLLVYRLDYPRLGSRHEPDISLFSKLPTQFHIQWGLGAFTGSKAVAA
jgi:hypothetical protein